MREKKTFFTLPYPSGEELGHCAQSITIVAIFLKVWLKGLCLSLSTSRLGEFACGRVTFFPLSAPAVQNPAPPEKTDDWHSLRLNRVTSLAVFTAVPEYVSYVIDVAGPTYPQDRTDKAWALALWAFYSDKSQARTETGGTQHQSLITSLRQISGGGNPQWSGSAVPKPASSTLLFPAFSSISLNVPRRSESRPPTSIHHLALPKARISLA